MRRRSCRRCSSGERIFDLAVTSLKQSGGVQLPGTRRSPCHDTYGFPIDLTLEMAAEQVADTSTSPASAG